MLIACPQCEETRYIRRDVFNKQGASKCLKCFNKKHGQAINAKNKLNKDNWLYSRWMRMKYRCKKYPTYIRKGIQVCDEWQNSFETFRDWCIQNNAQIDLELDRKDNKKGYSPENCRWVRHKENCRPGGRDKKSGK